MKTLLFIFCSFFFIHVVTAQNSNSEFKSFIERYARSIDQADTTLAKQFWSQSPEVSFINPRSTEYGWRGVKNIYRMFADNFTKRSLKGFNEKVTIYGKTAWLTFEWVFDATFKHNGAPMQTRGRESQIWHKEGREWKLVHIHYSGLPLNGQGQGF